MTKTHEMVVAEHAARVAAHVDASALCLDLDGTLAPIVDDPNEARPLPGTVVLLGHLAARFAAVALLSGRPAEYLAKHVAAPGLRYLGSVRAARDPRRARMGRSAARGGASGRVGR